MALLPNSPKPQPRLSPKRTIAVVIGIIFLASSIYTLWTLSGVGGVLNSQSVLNPGDIAFVQYNADGTDNFAFVALTDISGGTIIYFTDNEENSLSGNEGTLTWEAPGGGLVCGAVVTIDTDQNASQGNIINERNNFDLGGTGDGILAFQGSSNTSASTYLAAISNDGGSWGSNKVGNLPAGLTNGTNALAVNPEVDNVVYNGSTFTGDQNTLLTAINDFNNWTGGNNSTPQTFVGSFVVVGCSGGACVLDLATSNVTACDDNGTDANMSDDTYTVDATVNFSNPPATGTLSLGGDVQGSYSIAVGSLAGNSHTFTSVTLAADGASKTISAAFSDEPSCTDSEALAAVSSCSSIIPAGYIYFDNDAGNGNWNTAQNWSNDQVPNPANDNIYIGAGFSVNNNTGGDFSFDNGNDFQLFGTLAMNNKNLEVKTSGGFLTLGSTAVITNVREFFITNAGGLIESGSSVAIKHFKVSDNSIVTIDSKDFEVTQKLELIGSSEVIGSGCVTYTGSDYTNTGNGIYGCTGSASACTNSGSNDICGASAFPVEYLQLDAVETTVGVSFRWVTATELSNDYFVVQRRSSSQDWQSLGQVEGQGNSNEPVEYEFRDLAPQAGSNQYRLRQVDLDGKSSLSSVKEVFLEQASSFQIKAYPNPLQQGETLKLQIANGKELQDATVEIASLHGASLFQKQYSSQELARSQGLLELDLQLSAGTYLVVVRSGDKQATQRLVLSQE